MSDELAREVVALRAQCQELQAVTRERNALRRTLVATSEELDRARAWIKQHADHPPDCAAVKGYPPCDCGLDDLRALNQ